ncbi:hypothetical protein B0T18DRAFT_433429 [Schizothecium vesticola]|uniref:Nephrocystin 3-like N-terminal domain-containing protein n=1 Tax=Schizothecium vesticola TaxID=314040 RepID=A0AA40BQQ7_9PEZI|nr:hypothetical protein B0T18DRAFT_433429 [Schizothecium vesticola]
MDPISAVGFASAVLTFVEFSWKLVKGSYDIYRSDTNTTADTVSISAALKDLEDVTGKLRVDCQGASHHRDFLKDLAAQCLVVSGELSALLSDLERKEGNKVWRSVETKWKIMRKEKDIAFLEQRLASLRLQLLLRLTTIMSEEQSSVKAKLDKIQAGNVSIHSQAVGELTAIQEGIQELKTTLATQMSEDSGPIGPNLSGSLAEIQKSLSSILAFLDAVPKSSKMEECILRRLHFPQMWTREETVGKAEFDTFNWFLDLEADLDIKAPDDSKHVLLSDDELHALELARRQFLGWLETGSLVFHISGKAGSGKSTLMKFLYHHPRVKELLQQWAGPKNLVIAGFFFWSSGTPEEKSLVGLYQSILFQTLQQYPELIQQTFPRYWSKDCHNLANLDTTPFQLSELRRAMELLVSQDRTAGHRFLFFIDGLDEFEAT